MRWLFDQPQICDNCVGHGFCCQRNACNCHPLDFDNDIKKMEKALETGNYAINFARFTANAFIRKGKYLTLDVEHILHTSEESLYIRPRNVSRPIVDIIHLDENEHEGPCIFWSYYGGCKLPYEKRPMFGRTTIPSEIPSLGCCSFFDILELNGQRKKLCADWKPYTRDLFRLAQKFFDESYFLYQELNITLKKENIG